jgi:hypothetical protein
MPLISHAVSLILKCLINSNMYYALLNFSRLGWAIINQESEKINKNLISGKDCRNLD